MSHSGTSESEFSHSFSEATPSLAYVKPDSKVALIGADTAAFDACLVRYSDLNSACISPTHQDLNQLQVHFALDGKVMFIDNVLTAEECKELCQTVDTCPQLSFWSEKGRNNEEARAFRDADTIEVKSATIAGVIWTRVAHLLDTQERYIHIADKEDAENNPRWERELPGEWRPYGLNQDLLFAKYPSGGAFAPHTDGRAIHSFNERSFDSVIVFLNSVGPTNLEDNDAIASDYGGGTRFYANEALQSLALVGPTSTLLETGISTDEAIDATKQMDCSQTKQDTTPNSTSSRWSAHEEHLLLNVEPRAGRMLLFDQALVHEGVPPCAPFKKYIIRSDIMYRRTIPLYDTPNDREAYAKFREAEVLAEAGDVAGSILLFKQALRQSPGLAQIMGM